MINNRKTIAFDADDTLWHNEPYFDEAQERFCELFSGFASKQELLTLILNHQVNLYTVIARLWGKKNII